MDETPTAAERFMAALLDLLDANESMHNAPDLDSRIGASFVVDRAESAVLDAFNDAVDERVQQALDRWGMA